jgi:hypothetical protein
VTRCTLPDGSSPVMAAIASATSQTMAARSTGVRTSARLRGATKHASVSAPESATAIDMGAMDQGSAAARRRNESAATRSRAEDIPVILGPGRPGVKGPWPSGGRLR